MSAKARQQSARMMAVAAAAISREDGDEAAVARPQGNNQPWAGEDDRG
jgi:hypothetical protein